MAPSAVVEHVILDNALVTQKVEILPLEERAPKPEVVRSVKPAFEFSKAVLLEQNPMRTGSKTLDVAVAVMLHVIVIATPILLGLFYTDTINITQYASMLLVAPAPPPPPPPPASSAAIKASPMRRVFMSGGKLLAPTVIPKEIAQIEKLPSNQIRSTELQGECPAECLEGRWAE